jgi:hypothetical protein
MVHVSSVFPPDAGEGGAPPTQDDEGTSQGAAGSTVTGADAGYGQGTAVRATEENRGGTRAARPGHQTLDRGTKLRRQKGTIKSEFRPLCSGFMVPKVAAQISVHKRNYKLE